MIIHQPHNSAGGYAYNTVIYKNIEYAPHFHTNFEVIYVFSGRIDAVIGGKALSLFAGDMALCLSNEIHEYKTVENSECWVTVFSRDFVPEFERRVKGKVAESSRVFCCEEALSFLKNAFLKPDTEDHFLISACLNLICGEFLKNTRLLDKSSKEFSRINEIADFMSENFKSPLTLRQTSAALGYERCYFSKLFKTAFGVGFGDYLATLRFNEAARLLTHSSKTITEIALESGFGSVRTFNETFKKKSGMTPAEYRGKTRNKLKKEDLL